MMSLFQFRDTVRQMRRAQLHSRYFNSRKIPKQCSTGIRAKLRRTRELAIEEERRLTKIVDEELGITE